MIKLTQNERQILDDITNDCFYEDGLDSVIWADCFLDTTCIPSKEARGVLASLIKKEVICPIERGREGTIAFTPYGKKLMVELGYEE